LATLREIKSRISGVKNTEKITRAMKMVSAVKFRKAQENVMAARPYAKKIADILQSLLPACSDIENPLLKEREVKRICLMVVTSDRGFAGPFNTNLIKEAEKLIKEKYANMFNSHNLTLVTLGKKSFDYFSKRNYDVYAKYVGIFDRLDFINAQKIVMDLLEGFNTGKFDKVVMIYNEFKSAAQSKITEEQFLPIASLEAEQNPEGKVNDYIFEPSVKDIIDYMLPKHLNTQIWRVMLESFASEHAARMLAMDSATNNANELIRDLQLHYNKARQASITKELLEIVSGAEALKESN
jgi:F-type H+-transporting ATPase subunit gamma